MTKNINVANIKRYTAKYPVTSLQIFSFGATVLVSRPMNKFAVSFNESKVSPTNGVLVQQNGTLDSNQFDTFGCVIIQPVIVTNNNINEYIILAPIAGVIQLRQLHAVDAAQQAN